MNNLAEAYIDYIEPEEATEREAFKVDSIQSAEWCLKKIAWHQKKKAQALEFFQNELAKLEAYLEQVNADHDSSIAYFTGLLKPYAAQELDGTSKKTVKLPSGNLSFKKLPPVFVKNDEELVEFLRPRFPEYVKVKEEPDWKNFKKTCIFDGGKVIIPETGEIVPVTSEEKEDSFTVKVNADV